MTFGRLQVDVGMDVTDTDENTLGHVKDMGEGGFTVARVDGGGETMMPYDAIQAIVGNRVALKPHPESIVTSDQGNLWDTDLAARER